MTTYCAQLLDMGTLHRGAMCTWILSLPLSGLVLCNAHYYTYMLRQILQISVLVCSFLDQHGDLPESYHLLTLPKLCAVVSSLQTRLECVAAEHP